MRRALRRRYGAARKRRSGADVTVHQCPGCGEPVAVKRVSRNAPSGSEDEGRMCPRCQAAGRRAEKRLAAERRTAREAAKPKTVAVYDALGFYLGERPEHMTDAEWIASTYGKS